VTPRRKAAASILAADMQRFVELEPAARIRLALTARKVPLFPEDAAYTCSTGLLVPSEFSVTVGMEWNDALSVAVKF
jgi:hypothetical protein